MSDSLPEFTDDDLDVLMEALEAWEAKDLAGDMTRELIDSMMVKQHGPMPPAASADRQREKIERDQAKRQRKERSVLLRAKLIQIRDRRYADRITREALA